jgi:O-antigen/teichoic acid export membrane protein
MPCCREVPSHLMTPSDDDREKRQDVAHAARSGGMQVLTVAAQALVSVTHVLLARLFGRAVFGSYQACLAVLELVTRGATGGAGGGMLRYVAGPRARGQNDEVRSAIGTGLRLCLLISGGAALLLVAGAGPLARLMREPVLETALRILAPAAIVTGAMGVLVQASLAAKVTRANFYVRGLGEPALLLVAGLTAALFGRSLATLAVAHVFAALATLLLAIFAVGRVFGPGELRRSLGSPPLPGFVKFSLPLAAGDVLNGVLQRADILLLITFVGKSAAGVYAAAEFITRVIASARSVFDSVAAPVFSEAIHLGQRERLKQNLIMMNRWVVSVAAPIALTVAVLRRDLLALYGPDFQEGAAALAVLAVSHTVNVSFGLSGWILIGGGKSRTQLKNNLVVAVVNIALGLALIPRFGLLGTAFAALGGVVLLHLLVFVEVGLGFGAYPFDRTILKPLAAAAAALAVEALVETHVAPTGLRVPLVIVGGLGTYLTTLLALGLAPEERRLMAALRDRVRARRARRDG